MQSTFFVAAFLAFLALCLASLASAQVIVRSESLDNVPRSVHPEVLRAAENLRDIQERITGVEGLKPNPNRYVIVSPGEKLAKTFQKVPLTTDLSRLQRRHHALQAPKNAGFSGAVFDRVPNDREQLVAQVPHLSPHISRIDPNLVV